MVRFERGTRPTQASAGPAPDYSAILVFVQVVVADERSSSQVVVRCKTLEGRVTKGFALSNLFKEKSQASARDGLYSHNGSRSALKMLASLLNRRTLSASAYSTPAPGYTKGRQFLTGV